MKSKTLKFIYLTSLFILLSSCGKQDVPETKEAVDSIISLFNREQVTFFKENINNNISYINYKKYALDYDNKVDFASDLEAMMAFEWFIDEKSKGFRKQLLITIPKVFKEAGYDFEETFLAAIESSKKDDEFKLYSRLFERTRIKVLFKHSKEMSEAGVISEDTVQYFQDIIKKRR